ncbi:MAG: ATP-dependent Clp protease proteolytic subunit [Candidatus Omnitrophica bacterium]|nr:ATP-dependent Clp protease proteolytic subunit [Candidatus Omnitrophota bacterium]
MKKILMILLLTPLVACSTTSKVSVKVTEAKVAHSNIAILANVEKPLTQTVKKEVKRVSVTLEQENTILLNDSVNETSIAKLQIEFLEKHSKLPRSKPIYLLLDTPGGSILSGAKLLDTIRASKRKVHTITIFAASMGHVLVQELGDRLILGSGILMQHRARLSGISGQLDGEFESQLGFFKSLTEQFNKNAAKRIGVTLEEFKSSVLNEYWAFGSKAVEENHADAIADAVCGESLTGIIVEDKEVLSLLGKEKVQTTTSKCPLIQGFLDVKINGVSNPKMLQEFNQKYKDERKLP